MANLKDLIVNGPARFLGKIYGKISNAESADIARTLGKTVECAFSTTNINTDLISTTYNGTTNIGRKSYDNFSITIDANVEKIISTSSYEMIISSITAKNGSFVNGQHLSIYGSDVKLPSSIAKLDSGLSYSNSGIIIKTPNGSANTNPSTPNYIFSTRAMKWHDFVYWNGKWYGENYCETFAINTLEYNEYLPVASASMYNYLGKNLIEDKGTYTDDQTINLGIAGKYYLHPSITTSGKTVKYLLPSADQLPPVFLVQMGNPCSQGSTATIQICTSSGNVIRSRGFASASDSIIVLLSMNDRVVHLGSVANAGTPAQFELIPYA